MQQKEAERYSGALKPDTIMIEEKSSSGNVIHRYARGKFLGKVFFI
jgi:hypothetical protein